MKNKKQKESLLKHLMQTPIIELACKKGSVARATFYRWREEDKDFLKASDDALSEGRALINEMAESQLIMGIREKQFTSVAFWLKHNHNRYGNKLDITHRVDDEPLTPEQEDIVKKALALAITIEPEEKSITHQSSNQYEHNTNRDSVTEDHKKTITG